MSVALWIVATGLAVLMACAVVLHLRRHAPRVLAMPVLLLLLAVVAAGRFGPVPFGG